jgi:tripartite-type tricarboxylate transporter receptor subunit TctC
MTVSADVPDRTFGLAAASAMSAVCTAADAADARAAAMPPQLSYPSKPIRIIVMSTPASGPDIIARLIAQKLMEAWGQQVVVDNCAGASGAIGAEIASRSAPDGYTLMIATAQHAITAALFDKLATT